MSEIVWEEPPPATGGPGAPTAKLLAPLSAQPGRWARLRGPDEPTRLNAMAHRIKSGAAAGVQRGEFEAVVRSSNGESFLYARYVGGES